MLAVCVCYICAVSMPACTQQKYIIHSIVYCVLYIYVHEGSYQGHQGQHTKNPTAPTELKKDGFVKRAQGPVLLSHLK